MRSPLHAAFREHVASLRAGPAPTAERFALLARLPPLFRAQLASRHVDHAARHLKAEGRGHYTIASAGHEGNAAVAAALAPTDPALLHYRSGAFFLARADQAGYRLGVRDMLRGLVGSREEPVAGGRHKVFGNLPLRILPQTSTIASHLPRAVGLASAIERARRLGRRVPVPEDAIVVSSFGDASTNHSTAVGAIHAAARATFQRLPLPVLFVCEDNGLGISVPTPPGWIEAAFSGRAGLAYHRADGTNLADTLAVAEAAAAQVREQRRPAFLHLTAVRLLGHAGSDVEMAYRTPAAIRADEARDPLRATATLLIEAGVMTADEVLAVDDEVCAEVKAAREAVLEEPGLSDAAEILAPLAPRRPAKVRAEAERGREHTDARRRFWADGLPEDDGPLPLGGHLRAALGDLLATQSDVLVFGEDVGVKGGVYGVTRGLHRRAGALRVFDAPLDETTILGLALGAAVLGFVPVAEVQYLAYLHNAIDQLRGEAATLSFFTRGQLRNGLVLRIASFADPHGFGGHFHNENAVASLLDIPGLAVAVPSQGDDGAALLRTLVAAARVDGTVGVLLEPTALYRARDLHREQDGAWATPYQVDGHVPIGEARVWGDGRDLLLVSFGNGVPLCLRAAERLRREGIESRVLDLRWLLPLPVADLRRQAAETGAVLVVDETRRRAGVSEGVFTALAEEGPPVKLARVTGHDTFVPLGPAARHVLPSLDEVLAVGRRLAGRG